MTTQIVNFLTPRAGVLQKKIAYEIDLFYSAFCSFPLFLTINWYVQFLWQLEHWLKYIIYLWKCYITLFHFRHSNWEKKSTPSLLYHMHVWFFFVSHDISTKYWTEISCIFCFLNRWLSVWFGVYLKYVISIFCSCF